MILYGTVRVCARTAILTSTVGTGSRMGKGPARSGLRARRTVTAPAKGSLAYRPHS